MRIVFFMLVVFVALFALFVVTNPSQRVDVNLIFTPYPDVPLFMVVFVALAVGVGVTAAVALYEGATIRLANRRLRREIQRLETEASFLRTQSRTSTDRDADDYETPRRSWRDEPVDEDPGPPGAPVYDVGAGDSATRGD